MKKSRPQKGRDICNTYNQQNIYIQNIKKQKQKPLNHRQKARVRTHTPTKDMTRQQTFHKHTKKELYD